MNVLLRILILCILKFVHGSVLQFGISTRETTNCADRNTPGLICESCSRVATCILINKEWRTIMVADCNSDVGQYCNIREGGCSNKTGPCHPYGIEGSFDCIQDGVFPDPYDCQKYHMCYRFNEAYVDLSVNCSRDKAFNPATGDCSMTLEDTICKVTQYSCDRVGATVAWPGNSNIFYVCILRDDSNTFYPALYRCGPGEIFDGVNCVRGLNGTEPVGSVSTTKDLSSIYSSTESNIVSGRFRCYRSGLFYDLSRCDIYYYCNALLIARVYQCPRNSYFNRRIKACTVGHCIYKC